MYVCVCACVCGWVSDAFQIVLDNSMFVFREILHEEFSDLFETNQSLINIFFRDSIKSNAEIAFMYIYRFIGLVSGVFANGPRHTKDFKNGT